MRSTPGFVQDTCQLEFTPVFLLGWRGVKFCVRDQNAGLLVDRDLKNSGAYNGASLNNTPELTVVLTVDV